MTDLTATSSMFGDIYLVIGSLPSDIDSEMELSSLLQLFDNSLESSDIWSAKCDLTAGLSSSTFFGSLAEEPLLAAGFDEPTL